MIVLEAIIVLVFAGAVTAGLIYVMWKAAEPKSPYPTEISEDEYR